MSYIDIEALSKQADGRPLYHVKINTESNSFLTLGKTMKDTNDILEIVQALQEELDALGIAHIMSLDDQLEIRRV
jgi:hypothetical protein